MEKIANEEIVKEPWEPGQSYLSDQVPDNPFKKGIQDKIYETFAQKDH